MKISIITVTLNSEKTLQETIDSVAGQNYDDLEYIIVDGGSTDSTLDIIKKNNNKISRWISEKDYGISDAFNKGIKLSSGDVVGIINSDDMLSDDALNTIEKNMREDTDVLYGNAISFAEDISPYLERASSLDGLYTSMVLLHPAVFVRKSAYEQYGFFDIQYKCCMDRDLLLRMYTHGAKFQYIDTVLAKIRQGGVNQRLYLTTTVTEGERISIAYGMSKWKAKTISILKRVRFYLRAALLRTRLGQFIKMRKNNCCKSIAF